MPARFQRADRALHRGSHTHKKDWAKQQVTHLRAWLEIIGNVKLSRVTSYAIERARKVLLHTRYKRADTRPESAPLARPRQSLLRRVAALHGQFVRLETYRTQPELDRVNKFLE